MNILITLSFSLILSLILTVFLPNISNAAKIDEGCTNVEVIFARGSGGEIGDMAAEATRYFDQLKARIKVENISYGKYELGAEVYNGQQYPAVAVDKWSFLNGLGASLSAGNHFNYGESVKKGIGELQAYLKQRHAKCEESGTRYILGGVSQGAQVIGQALSGINQDIRNDIVFVGLFGDPKLHYPEGEGWNPPACRGKDFSPWRRAASNCDLDNGSLGSRRPYLPDDMKAKTGLWCYQHDMICDPGAIFQTSGHGEYKNEGRAIDSAAREAVERLKYRLKQDNPPPQPIPGQPTPPPPVDYDRVLDVRRVVKEGTTGENTVFAIDVSDSMKLEIPAIEQFLRNTIPKIVAKGGKVSVVVYIGVKDGNGNVIDNTGVISPFGIDPQYLLDALDDLLHPNGEHLPGSSLITLNTIFDRLNWDNGATKSVTLFSNTPLVDPDFVGLTVDGIARKSLEIDPVNIYPVVPEASRESYIEIATKTSGQVITYTDSILQAANQAYEKITNRPVPFLKNTEYIAEPGQEITFNASDSYVLDATITKYEWDYNGDGQFETTTTTPSVNHTYTSPFTGYMQVRTSANNGTVANMSARVIIDTITPQSLPASPKNLAYNIASTTENKSTITINWQADPGAEAWFIKINDMPMGYVEAGRTSLEITDINRTSDVIIGVANANSANNKINMSEFSSITIPAIKTTPPSPPPVVSACNQSNLFIQIICKAIALFRAYIQGSWYYVLPYRL